MKTQAQAALPLRQTLTNKYNSARINLLLVIALTVLNIVLLFLEADYYLLFSASIPYYFTLFAMLFCGKFPVEYYGGEAEYKALEAEGFWPESTLTIALVISVVIVVLYLVCFLFSKNLKYGWLVFALVLFVADTIGLFLLADLTTSIIDLVFHAWILIILVVGIVNAVKLKNLPPEESSGEDVNEKLFQF